MTLKCVADGNPAPTSFNFHLKVQILIDIPSVHATIDLCRSPVPFSSNSNKQLFDCMCLKGELVKVENTDTYTITNVSRDTSGEYKCSLIDDPSLEASEDITVNCKKNQSTTILYC